MMNKSLINFSKKNFFHKITFIKINVPLSFCNNNINKNIVNILQLKTRKNSNELNKYSKRYFYKKTNILELNNSYSNNKNHYEILGVKRESTIEQIKKAYLTLAKQLHPDVNREKGADERFKNITLAYEELSDENKRKNYDASLGGHYNYNDNYNEDEEFSRRNERAKYDRNSNYYKNSNNSNFWGNSKEEFEDQFFKDYDNLFNPGNKHIKQQKGDDILVRKRSNEYNKYIEY
jgi:hypothetical protein